MLLRRPSDSGMGPGHAASPQEHGNKGHENLQKMAGINLGVTTKYHEAHTAKVLRDDGVLEFIKPKTKR